MHHHQSSSRVATNSFQNGFPHIHCIFQIAHDIVLKSSSYDCIFIESEAKLIRIWHITRSQRHFSHYLPTWVSSLTLFLVYGNIFKEQNFLHFISEFLIFNKSQIEYLISLIIKNRSSLVVRLF